MPQTIAFFGATGGCGNAVLVLTLNGGYACTALARTPKKLRDMLTAAGVSEAAQAAQLRIVEGDAKDVDAVADTLQGADVVVSGIGMDPFVKNPQTTICQDATRSILEALRRPGQTRRPHLAIISTTGISEGPRDVPLGFLPMYKYMLKVPHEDKLVMEKLVIDEGNKPDAVIAGWTLVRPSFLMSGDEKPASKVKTGSEEQPEVGYVINRKDVGRWMFDKLINGDAAQWAGKKPTITL